MGRVALVTGGNGASGNALLEHFVHKTSSAEWSRIVVTSRSALRRHVVDPRIQFVQLDFRQRPGELVKRMSETCAGVTHAFFASHAHSDDSHDVEEVNAAMFENFLLALTSVARGLQRCVLQTDSRHYGSHLAHVPTPCREGETRRGEHIYHTQEDFMAMLQTNQDWTWSVVRPEVIIGSSSSPKGVNTALTLAVYFLITRELAEEAKMPTNQRYWNGSEVTSDAILLADFMIWVAISEDCANEAFNLANGDHFTWRFMWPRLADFLGAYSTPDQNFEKPEPQIGDLQQEFSLAEWAADKRPVWQSICEAADIPNANEIFDAAAWQTHDRMFQRSWSCNVSINKAREFGYTGFIDSFASFASAFADLRAQRKIP